MLPTLVDLPAAGIRITAHQVFVYASIAIVLFIAPRVSLRLEGIEPRRTRWLMLALVLTFLVGARLHYILVRWPFSVHLPVLTLTRGVSTAGGLVLTVLAAPALARLFGVPLGRFADSLIPTEGVAFAVARVGCLLAGCCYGDLCTSPWCITYPPYSLPFTDHYDRKLIAVDAPASLPIHPLPVYFIAAALLMSAAALWLYPRRRFPGQIALCALAWFAASSTLVELFRGRGGDAVIWAGREHRFWAAAALAVAAVIALGLAQWLHRPARRGLQARELRCITNPGRTDHVA